MKAEINRKEKALLKKIVASIICFTLCSGNIWAEKIHSTDLNNLNAPANINEQKILAGNVLAITVKPAEELSNDYFVQEDGKIELPLIGAVKAEGLTIQKLETVLSEKLLKYVKDPVVRARIGFIQDKNSIILLGQATMQGYYKYSKDMTLSQLISGARGYTDFANIKKVRIVRYNENNVRSVRNIDFNRILLGDLPDFTLQGGDMVYIPKKFLSAGSWFVSTLLPWATFILTLYTISKLAKD